MSPKTELLAHVVDISEGNVKLKLHLSLANGQSYSFLQTVTPQEGWTGDDMLHQASTQLAADLSAILKTLSGAGGRFYKDPPSFKA